MKTLFFLASFCIMAWVGLILMNSSNFSVDQLRQRILTKEVKTVSDDDGSGVVEKAVPYVAFLIVILAHTHEPLPPQDLF